MQQSASNYLDGLLGKMKNKMNTVKGLLGLKKNLKDATFLFEEKEKKFSHTSESF